MDCQNDERHSSLIPAGEKMEICSRPSQHDLMDKVAGRPSQHDLVDRVAGQAGLGRRGCILVTILSSIIILLTVVLVVIICVGLNSESTKDNNKSWAKIPDGDIFQQLIDPEEKKASFWWKQGQDFLQRRLRLRQSHDRDNRTAKNVVMFIGDGMGPATLTAARWYKGQVEGDPRASLAWEKWGVVAMARTYCVDGMVADSGCSATAYLAGVKGNQWSVGVSGQVNDCRGQEEEMSRQEVTSMLKWAQDEGKATGIVTTDEITGASPAGCFAHVASRRWKDDSRVVGNCSDIAMQLVREEPGRNVNVLLGRGRKYFLPREKGGQRKEGDLVEEWREWHNDTKSKFIENPEELDDVSENTEYLLGLFEGEEKPNLTHLTRKAIRILTKNPRGFFLFVENQHTDDPAHKNKAGDVLKEVLHLEETVEAVEEVVDDDTMLLVTADHSHTLSMSGYPARGRDILGKVREFQPGVAPAFQDDYSILNYATGPGVAGGGFPSLYHKASGRHGGDDVAVYVKGPGSQVFGGSMDQAAIPHLVAYGACLGKGIRHHNCGP